MTQQSSSLFVTINSVALKLYLRYSGRTVQLFQLETKNYNVAKKFHFNKIIRSESSMRLIRFSDKFVNFWSKSFFNLYIASSSLD